MRTASHFAPASHVTSIAPSLPYITCLLLSGSIQIAWLSTWPMLLSPFQVLPPSIDLVGPTPPRYTVSQLFGSTRIWLKYIGRWFSFDWNVQVLPLSIDLNTPEYCGFGTWLFPRPPRPCPPPAAAGFGAGAAGAAAAGG